MFAQDAGLVEYLLDLGDPVTQGQVIARIWPSDRTGEQPKPCVAGCDGILAARHAPGLIKLGDFAALVAVPL